MNAEVSPRPGSHVNALAPGGADLPSQPPSQQAITGLPADSNLAATLERLGDADAGKPSGPETQTTGTKPHPPSTPKPPVSEPRATDADHLAAGSPLVAARQLAVALPGTLAVPSQLASPSQATAPLKSPVAVPTLPLGDIGITTLASVTDACAKIIGERSGQLTGGITTPHKLGSLKVVGLAHRVSVPLDARGGLRSSAHTHHEPLIAVLAVDVATPQLYRAMTSHETLASVVLDLYGGDAAAAPAFRIELVGARITAVQLGWGAVERPEHAPPGPTVAVSFVYSKIAWSWVQGGETSTATWAH